ncbi:MAG: hypothetical protein Q8J74_05460 [Candidatus Didemnitutus sp.]|nr:hypothetical protein [Candidatus Didemnitutus sp.]
MKHPLFSCGRLWTALLILPMLLLAASSAFAADKAGSDLLIKVNLPKTWQDNRLPGDLSAAFEMEHMNTMKGYDARLRAAFVQRLAAVFRREGYTGKMALIDTAPESARGQPILVIELDRWVAAASGRFDCYFKARLVTIQGETDLGTLEYSDAMIQRRSNAFRDTGIEQATDVALAQFHGELVSSGRLALLPAGS